MYEIIFLIAASAPSGLNDNLKVQDAAEEVYLVVPATGVQIYECGEKDAKWGWQFKAPEATLYDEARANTIGKHYGGPTWEANDGSKIKGTVKSRQDAAAATDIPWLLLDTTTDGLGRFAGTTHIQRVNTSGGVAPKGKCDKAMSGMTERVDYKADYYFYRKKTP
jgi:hypothetical protein